MSEAKRATFEVHLGATGASSRVFINGQDVSRAICGIEIKLDANGQTQVTLKAVYGSSVVTLNAALNAEQVKVEPPSGVLATL